MDFDAPRPPLALEELLDILHQFPDEFIRFYIVEPHIQPDGMPNIDQLAIMFNSDATGDDIVYDFGEGENWDRFDSPEDLFPFYQVFQDLEHLVCYAASRLFP